MEVGSVDGGDSPDNLEVYIPVFVSGMIAKCDDFCPRYFWVRVLEIIFEIVACFSDNFECFEECEVCFLVCFDILE